MPRHEEQEYPCGNKATHVSLIGRNSFREDNQAQSYICGDQSDEFGLDFLCKGCMYKKGYTW